MVGISIQKGLRAGEPQNNNGNNLSGIFNILTAVTLPLRDKNNLETFISSANSVLKLEKESEDCKKTAHNVGEKLFTIIGNVKIPQTHTLSALIAENSGFKIFELATELANINHIATNCIEGDFNIIKMSLIKSILFHDMVENKLKTDTLGLGLHVANLMIKMKENDMKLAGEEFGKLLEKISKIDVGKPDSQIENFHYL